MKYLTFEERKMLEKLLYESLSFRKVAKILCRSHTTVAYEIKTNRMPYERHYIAETAHKRFLDRQRRKGNISKLKKDPKLKEFIVNKLKTEQWSPEQISGALKLQHGKGVISHETIYQFIYSDEGKTEKLWLSMRHKKKPIRQPWGSRKKRITIHFR